MPSGLEIACGPAYNASRRIVARRWPPSPDEQGGRASLKQSVVRYSRLTGGSLLVLFGVISGFLPVLQGWMFILAGLAIMAPESERARRALDWVKARVQRTEKGKEADGAPDADRGEGIDEQ